MTLNFLQVLNSKLCFFLIKITFFDKKNHRKKLVLSLIAKVHQFGSLLNCCKRENDTVFDTVKTFVLIKLFQYAYSD